MKFKKPTRYYLKLDSSVINKLGEDLALSIRQSCQSAKTEGFKHAIVDIEINYIFTE